VRAEFWCGKRVFMTGHTGFKGSWLSLWLESLGSNVTGLSLAPPTSPNLFEEVRIEKGMTSHISDIRDLSKLKKAMQEAKPEIVIHMAAQPLVRKSYSDPVETYATNVMGTVNVLESVRQTPSVKAVVVVTTDKCYENKEWLWGYRETEPMGGHDPYSSSKGCAELITEAYRRSFFQQHDIRVATARAGNVIGGGDWAEDRLVPDILKAFEKNQVVSIRNPQATRPWQHVLEPLAGYMQLAQRLYEDGQSFATAWNFGPNDHDAKSVQSIVKDVLNIWGDRADWIINSDAPTHEAQSLKLDCSKAKLQLGWKPQWTIEKTLARIVNWHRQWLAGADMYAYSMAEIYEYTHSS